MKLFISLLVLQVFGYQTSAEVVQSFKTSCPQFFIENPSDQNVHYPPTVLHDAENPQRYQQICQRLDNAYRYATLYDTKSRIPIYSAYKFVEHQNTKRCAWKIEPQLDDRNLGPEMAAENTVGIDVRGKNQALRADYASHKNESHSNYTRGHLFPRCHSESKECANATYTLTNAVPQTHKDNNRWNTEAENKIDKEVKKFCNKGMSHIVTGVVPGNRWLEIRRDNQPVEKGVNVPDYFWTAYCCPATSNQETTLKSTAWLGFRDYEEVKPLRFRKMSVTDLQNELTKLYGKTLLSEETFSVFGGLCQESNSGSIKDQDDIYDILRSLDFEFIPF